MEARAKQNRANMIKVMQMFVRSFRSMLIQVHGGYSPRGGVNPSPRGDQSVPNPFFPIVWRACLSMYSEKKLTGRARDARNWGGISDFGILHIF